MLDFKRYCVIVCKEILEDSDEVDDGTRWNHYYEAIDEMDAKRKARLDFGPGFEPIRVHGPFPILGS